MRHDLRIPTRAVRTRCLAAVCLMMAAGCAEAVTALVADYQFADDLTSSVGTAPPLAIVGPGTAFASETVRLGQMQTVLTFPKGSGLSLSPTNTNLLSSNNSYTIALLARITPDPLWDGYSKLIDFNNGTTYPGLYDNYGYLRFYNLVAGASAVFNTTYADIVLTNNGTTLSGYYDGILQFATGDAFQWGDVGVDNTLRFFLDDIGSSGTEASPGAVARIRIWNGALSDAEVLALTDPIFADAFEGGL